MITDILRPDSGDILWEGRPTRERGSQRIAYLPEERGLYRRTRTLDAVAFYGELKGLSAKEARAEAARLLERVELSDEIGKQVQALSKGMQQKVQICTALIGDPRLMILDEPFSGLDPINVELLEEVLRERRAAGATVLLSTHQMNKVEELCDRALMINRGHMVLYGAVRQLRRQYAEHAIVLRAEAVPESLPGVQRTERANGVVKLTLEADASPGGVVRALLDRGVEIESFSVASLPLEDIFIKVVREGLGLDHGESGPPTVDEPAARAPRRPAR